MGMSFDYGDQTGAIRTLYTQEMYDRGIIVSSNCYPSLTTTDELVDEFLAAVDEVFPILADAGQKGDAMSRLRGPVSHDDFRRLT